MVFRTRLQPLHRGVLTAVVLGSALAGLIPGLARAGATPDAQTVLDRHLAAIGGRDVFEKISSVHAMGRVTAFGLSGSIETWTVKPDLRASVMRIGPISMSQGFDGAHAWRTDTNGKILTLDGKDLERAIASAWFDNTRWLEPDHAGGTIRRAADDEQSDTHDVLEMTAPNGDTRLVWFTKSDGLIARTSMQNDQQRVRTELSDYQRFGGLLFPMRVQSAVEGMKQNDVVVTFDSVFVNRQIPESRFAPPGPPPSSMRYLANQGVASFSFDYGSRHIWLRASVNGHPPADFIFDTGASMTVIDSTYAAEIGLGAQGKLQGQGAGAMGSASLSTVDLLRVRGDGNEGVEASNMQVAVLSLNPHLEPFLWKRCAGVLGFNFINQFVSEIDYDARKLTLRDPLAFEYTGKGEAIPMTLAGTTPTISMTIDGVYEGSFRVDVGSSATVDLHTPFVAKHDLARKAEHSVQIMSGGFGGGFTTTVTRMKSIALGPYTWTAPLVSLSGAEHGALASADYAGNIGNRILERFKCTFDYERRVLYLEPGALYGAPDVFSKAGLQLGKFEDGVKAVQVLEGSAAAKAGMRKGDEVRSIDGKPAAEFSRAELDALFEGGKTGQKVAFELGREGKLKKVTLKLEELI